MPLRMRQERMKRKWTQEYVANKIGITVPAVQMLETGKCKPSYEVLVKLEDLFHMGHRKVVRGGNPGQHKRAGRQSGGMSTTKA